METQARSAPDRAGREIRNVALLDLTGAEAATALDGVTRISNVATILAPESLLARLSSIPMENVAATVPVPEGTRTRVFSGQITLGGDALAGSDADHHEVLVAAGQLILTSPVTRVGYTDLILLGQVIAPTGSETALGAVSRRLSGQVLYYPYVEGATVRPLLAGTISGEALANIAGQPTDILLSVGNLVVTSPARRLGYQHVAVTGNVVVPKDTDSEILSRLIPLSGQVVSYSAPPRVFDGKDHFSADFFELLDEPITLVLDGKFSFDQDIPRELLLQKLAALVFDGKIRAPRHLVPVLQARSIARDGKIDVDTESD